MKPFSRFLADFVVVAGLLAHPLAAGNMNINLDGPEGLGGLGDLLGALGGSGSGSNGAGGLGDLFGALGGSASGRGEKGQCVSNCVMENSASVPKLRIRPYSNGCSVPDFLSSGLGDYTHFTSCCHLHDACYMTCGTSQKFCDSEFHKCMKNECKKKFRSSVSVEQKTCRELADTFMVGVSMFGCGGFVDTQSEGCDCVSDAKEAKQRVKEYASDFYDTYNGTHALPDTILNKYFTYDVQTTSLEERDKKHGELLFRLYNKYQKSIDVVSTTGKGDRTGKVVRFEKTKGNLKQEQV